MKPFAGSPAATGAEPVGQQIAGTRQRRGQAAECRLSLYLYRLVPQGFVTPKPLSELAWAYFKGLPDSRKIKKPDFHIEAGLVKGTDDNYRSLGENWPDSRYLVILLSGEVSPDGMHGQTRLALSLRPAKGYVRRAAGFCGEQCAGNCSGIKTRP